MIRIGTEGKPAIPICQKQGWLWNYHGVSRGRSDLRGDPERSFCLGGEYR
jgi:hypothetical protein